MHAPSYVHVHEAVRGAFAGHHAIVIAIDDYGDPSLRLHNAVADGRSVASVLAREHGFAVTEIYDDVATLSRIRHLFEEELPGRVGRDDRVLIYVAGHGTLALSDRGPEGYLLFHGAKRGDATTYEAMRRIGDAISRLACRHLLLVLDCCFAGAFHWAAQRDFAASPLYREKLFSFLDSPAWQVLTSAASDETAADVMIGGRGDADGHSPFARALLDGLAGAADLLKDGVISATELYAFIRGELGDIDRRGRPQTPGLFQLKNHGKGEFVFSTPERRTMPPPTPRWREDDNPYRGLEAFKTEHKDRFFGRRGAIGALKNAVEYKRLTVVLGPSGTGKSSLVHAGVVPELEAARWRVIGDMRPGERPDEALAELLLAPVPDDTRAELLIVDQLEELITLCRDPKAQAAFEARLLDLVTRADREVHVVLTLRSDFEPSFAQGALKPHWMGARFLVSPMNREELREAIEKPAAQLNLYFDPPSLVDQLIDEVVLMPGALPLLSFTLSELFRSYVSGPREDRKLTKDDYEKIGGVTSSVTNRATDEMNALGASGGAAEATVRDVMLRMVSVEGGEPVRRRITAGELSTDDPGENARRSAVLERLTAARLLVAGEVREDAASGERTIEPAHDVLVIGWSAMRTWLKEDPELLLLLAALRAQTSLWAASEDPEWLWPDDPRLGKLVALAADGHKLNALEKRFVGASDEMRRAREAAQHQVEEKQRRTRQWVTSGAVIAAVVFLGLALYAFAQRSTAEANADAARAERDRANEIADERDQQRKVADERRDEAAAASKEATTQKERAQLGEREAEAQRTIAEESARSAEASARSAERRRILAEGARARALIRSGSILSGLVVAMRASQSAEYSPDTARGVWGALVESTLLTPEVALSFSFPKVQRVAFAPGQVVPKLLAFGERNAEARTISGGTSFKLELAEDDVFVDARFSPDGRLVFLKRALGQELWDATAIRLVATLPPDLEQVVFGTGHRKGTLLTRSLAGIAPGGEESGYRACARVWSLKYDVDAKGIHYAPPTPESQLTLCHDSDVQALAIALDGRIATAGPGQVRLWSAEGKELWTLPAPELASLSFTPDDGRILGITREGVVRSWEIASQKELAPVVPGGQVDQIWFSPDRERALTVGENVGLWNTERVAPWSFERWDALPFPTKPEQGYVRFVGSDGLVVAGEFEMHVWPLHEKVRDGTRWRALLGGHSGQIVSMDVSQDGAYIASAGKDALVRVWKLDEPVATERQQKALDGPFVELGDGTLDVSLLRDGEVLWRQPFENAVIARELSRDHRVVAVLDEVGNVTVLGGANGVPRCTYAHKGEERDIKNLALAANGALMAIVDGTNVVVHRTRDCGVAHVLAHTDDVSEIRLAPDASVLLSESTYVAQVWSMASGRAVNQTISPDFKNGVQFWPGAKVFEIGNRDDAVLYEAATGDELAHLGHGGSFVWPSEDGKRIEVEGREVALDAPALFSAGCAAIRGITRLTSVSDAEVEDVQRHCAARTGNHATPKASR